MNHRSFHLSLRACWPSCPSASTGWTCTTALPTLERWQERRRAQRGKTFSISSMNSLVSGARVINHMKCPHLLSAVDPGQKYSINLPSVSAPNPPPPLLHTSHVFSHPFSFLSPPHTPSTLISFSSSSHLEFTAGDCLPVTFICNELWQGSGEKRKDNTSCILL